MDKNLARQWNDLEVVWYRANGKYPERIKRGGWSVGLFVIGDWSWNTSHPDKPEYIEGEMAAWIRRTAEEENQ